MPLASYLSAVRELILDQGPPQGDQSTRRAALAKRFTALEEKELDDLSAISTQRFAFYRRLIHAGERSMLQWAFPISLAAIDRIRRKLGDQRSSREFELELVIELHRFRAWESHSARVLARNFCDFVNQNRRAWLEQWAGLSDLIEYERIEQEVFYAKDSPHQPIDPNQLRAMEVEDLLAMRVVRPQFAMAMELGCDVLSLGNRWRRDKTLPADFPGSSVTRAICYRDPQSLMPRWMRLDRARWAAITQAPIDEIVELECLAAAFLEASPPADEQTLFGQYFEALSEWWVAGILLGAKPD